MPTIVQKSKKAACNIMLTPEVRAMADHLAEQDHRSLSNQLQWLVEKEAGVRGISNAVVSKTNTRRK